VALLWKIRRENMKKYNLINILMKLGYTERGAKMVITRHKKKLELDMDKDYLHVEIENVKLILNCLKKINMISTFEKIEEFVSDRPELENSSTETIEIKEKEEITEASQDVSKCNETSQSTKDQLTTSETTKDKELVVTPDTSSKTSEEDSQDLLDRIKSNKKKNRENSRGLITRNNMNNSFRK
jgi:hypothetical protein